jgi:hypothetical protein
VSQEVANTGDGYQLRFYGEGISPGTIPVADLTEILGAIDSAIRAIILERDENANKASLFLVSIDNQSLGLQFVPNFATKAAVAFAMLSSVIQSQVYSGIPEKSITEIDKIVRFTHRYNCNGEINVITNGSKLTLATITPDMEIKRPAEIALKGRTSIFAYLLWAGGKNPKIHLILPDESLLNCKASKDLIKHLVMYDWYTFEGDAEWDMATGKIVSFRAIEATHRENPSALDAFTKISEKFSDMFGDDDPAEFFHDMRYGE